MWLLFINVLFITMFLHTDFLELQNYIIVSIIN